ncbi:flagellar filament capping protein FliD [Nocardioides sp. MAH-18]|uniref:Flagellar hook-associated protein 2 n=1 Tax=Nocardioides agri TaxID=2682843 RepID=A0A6L6XUC8_9ACTN|nr:flagellar filament capping protein FliD [Nocardioides sp. CGMCC 1.13656]MBA2955788.1 flagellar filament capping protein FliD [Nocardioides sp. CGMCC 1.13656]MVQ50638.1 flagellar filament capping protein FliD [Nocardioides sp. MAH-18]
MASSSISGIASGLDTASIIDQLMQLEAVPQTKLVKKQTTEKSILTALRSLNTDTAALAVKARSLAKPATWQAVQGTATGTGISVTTASTASPASLSFTVDRLAATHQLAFASSADLTTVVAGSTVTITGSDGVAHDISAGGGTLKELVAAINGSTATTGVKAAAVKVADGSYRLLAESAITGAGSAFTLTNGDGTDLLGGAAVRAGADAQISMGLGITATSSTNTFADLLPGVNVTLGATTPVGTAGTVTIAQSPATLVSNVKDLVDQVNSLLSGLDKATATGKDVTRGVLAGDSMARELRQSLLSTVFGDSTGTMAAYGVQTDRYGKLVFDQKTLEKAYADDPAGTAAKFTSGATAATDGWAARVASVAEKASKFATGTISAAIESHTSAVSRLDKGIAEWDDRLELRRATLRRQYTALETALGNLQSQGSWLSSQIASLPSYS